MEIPRILSRVYREPWAIMPESHEAICMALEAKLGGEATAPTALGGRQPQRTETGLVLLGPTALAPVYGILGKHLSYLETLCGGCDVDDVQAMLEEADQDPTIENLILAFDSPGGIVTGIPETGAMIADLAKRKNVVSFTDTVMCSAAYWLGSQAGALYCTQSARLGSIGVYLKLLDLTAQLEAEGVKVNTMSAGRYKLAGAFWKPLTDEERAMFQASVVKTYEAFTAAVRSGRGAVADETMQGQVFDGDDCAQLNLCDGVVSGIDEVVAMFQ